MTLQNNFHARFLCDVVQCSSAFKILKPDSKHKTSKKASAVAKSKGFSARSQLVTELGGRGDGQADGLDAGRESLTQLGDRSEEKITRMREQ